MEPFREAKAPLKARLVVDDRGRSVLVTSPGSGDGKTTIVANLSDALAEDGSSVIVVSSDLKSTTSIESYWGYDEYVPGLSNFLQDQSLSLDDIIQTTSRFGVSLITRGSVLEAALLKVDSSRMKELVDALTARADWVLLDAPATLRVTDAQRLSTHVDGTLLILHGVNSTLSAVKMAVVQISDAGGNLIGFFHNRYRGNPVTSLFR